MKESTIKLIFGISGFIILIGDIILIIIYFIKFFDCHCSYKLEYELDRYIKEHNLTEKKYNFYGLFYEYKESFIVKFAKFMAKFSVGLFNGAYVISSIIFYTLVVVSLQTKQKCILIFLVILFIGEIFVIILDLVFSFNVKEITNEELQDFDDTIKNDLNSEYNILLEGRYVMKICSSILAFFTVYNLVSNCILLHKVIKPNNPYNNNNYIPYVNQINNNGINPHFQSFNAQYAQTNPLIQNMSIQSQDDNLITQNSN